MIFVDFCPRAPRAHPERTPSAVLYVPTGYAVLSHCGDAHVSGVRMTTMPAVNLGEVTTVLGKIVSLKLNELELLKQKKDHEAVVPDVATILQNLTEVYKCCIRDSNAPAKRFRI